MTWNYRVMKRGFEYKDEFGNNIVEYQYGIHEVYYDDDGNITCWSENPIKVRSDDVEGLKWILKRFKKALKKSVVDYDAEYKRVKNV